jgi:hypothetical protein
LDGEVHLEGRPRSPLFLPVSDAKNQGPADIVPLLTKETVLGPASLEERGDRRRPRVISLAQEPTGRNGRCDPVYAAQLARRMSTVFQRMAVAPLPWPRSDVQGVVPANIAWEA